MIIATNVTTLVNVTGAPVTNIFLMEIAPQVEPPREGQPSNAQAMKAVEAWKYLDFLCHNYVLNPLKFQWNYDQPGHPLAICKMPKRVTSRQANMVNDNMDMIATVSDVIAMISKVNLVVDNGEKLYMGNSATSNIKGEGDVILMMTSEKELKLSNV
nr:hypothetical protein [Tanacetum cinerariifolium]